MEREEMLKKFNKPFIEGVEIKRLLTHILIIPNSRARAIYHDMRKKYQEDAESKNVIIFGNQVPTQFALNYLEALGLSKEYLLSKSE
ncbi:MAG: hypothetical protein K6G09_01565 [Treponema sp.]|nr:hypothetical protein [Treponema sp.]